MQLLNKTARAICFGSTMLIPAIAAKIAGTEAEIASTFPALGELIKAGDVVIVNDAEAAQAANDFEEMTKAELVDYARKHNITIDGRANKETILATIKAV